MRNFAFLLVAFAAVALGADGALGGDCRPMRATMAPADVWIGVVAFNDGRKSKRRAGCFVSERECWMWMRTAEGMPKGQTYACYCRNLGTGEMRGMRDRMAMMGVPISR